MVHKITRGVIAIAICWFIAYGVGSAASHCCSAIINTCSPSGVRSPLIPTINAHCQSSDSHHLNRQSSATEVAKTAWHGFNDPTTCCPASSCTLIGSAALPAQSTISLPWLHIAGNVYTNDGDHDTIAITQNRQTLYHPTVPIFLLTKSIIC